MYYDIYGIHILFHSFLCPFSGRRQQIIGHMLDSMSGGVFYEVHCFGSLSGHLGRFAGFGGSGALFFAGERAIPAQKPGLSLCRIKHDGKRHSRRGNAQDQCFLGGIRRTEAVPWMCYSVRSDIYRRISGLAASCRAMGYRHVGDMGVKESP